MTPSAAMTPCVWSVYRQAADPVRRHLNSTRPSSRRSISTSTARRWQPADAAVPRTRRRLRTARGVRWVEEPADEQRPVRRRRRYVPAQPAGRPPPRLASGWGTGQGLSRHRAPSRTQRWRAWDDRTSRFALPAEPVSAEPRGQASCFWVPGSLCLRHVVRRGGDVLYRGGTRPR